MSETGFDPGTRRASVVAALVAVQIFFGVHYLAAKVLLEEVPPGVWAGIRVTCGALLLLTLARGLGRPFPVALSDLGKLAVFSVFGIVVNQVCFIEGLSRTTATHSAIINVLIPVATLLFAMVFGRESLTASKAASVVLAFAGAWLVVRPDRSGWGSESFVGDLLTLTNALSYGFFLVISKRLLSRIDPLAATSVLMAFGAVIIVALGAPAIVSFDFGQVTSRAWMLGAFIVVFPTAAAYFLINWALSRSEPSLVAFFVFLQPLIAIALSVALRGERLTGSTVGGAALIFGGVYLALDRPTFRGLRRSAPAS